VTLFPIAVFLYRAEQGALVPTDVFIPILIATFCSTMTGLLITAWVQKINLIEKVLLLYLVTGFALVAAIVLYFLSISYSALATQSAFIANFLLLGFIVAILLFGVIKKINTYELFIDGAKQGFKLAIDLIPYLIAMLVAIGMLRQSGALGLVTDWIKSGVTFLGVDSRFVDLLPNGLMKPLSGSGARAMMIETMQHYGPDSFQGRLASIMQGSTETTFYILAVYLGAIGLKHTRYAVSCCLAADLSGIICAIAVCYWFFG
jgi:spore maturation protein SpmB